MGGTEKTSTSSSFECHRQDSLSYNSDEHHSETEDLLATPRVVKVVAPVDLHEGFPLGIEVEGSACVVEVPKGGVERGNGFWARPVRETSLKELRDPDQIPMGAWRDGLFACFKHGLFHPTLWLSFLCPGVALGQVLTRNGYDACGSPVADEDWYRRNEYYNDDRVGKRKRKVSAFRFMVALTVLIVVFNRLLYMVILERLPEWQVKNASGVDTGHTTSTYNSTSDHKGHGQSFFGGDDDDAPSEADVDLSAVWSVVLQWVHHALIAIYLVYAFILTARTRTTLRDRYSIPATFGSSDGPYLHPNWERNKGDALHHVKDVEDCCLSLCCRPCVVAQMLRHTANYHTHGSAFCQDTGLYQPNIV